MRHSPKASDTLAVVCALGALCGLLALNVVYWHGVYAQYGLWGVHA